MNEIEKVREINANIRGWFKLITCTCDESVGLVCDRCAILRWLAEFDTANDRPYIVNKVIFDIIAEIQGDGK